MHVSILCQNVLKQFLAAMPSSAISRILSSVEGHRVPIHSEADRRRGGQFGNKLAKLQPYGHRLVWGVNVWIYRQAFLWGVANYLGGLPHEEVIIGFGIAEGTRTLIESVMKVRGNAETVTLSPEQAIILHGYLNEDQRHAAILVHNHPSEHPVLWLLGLVFGEQPLPSLQDRDFGLDSLMQRVRRRLQGFALGEMRFFVIQNDAITEFSGITPAILMDVARRLFIVRLRAGRATGT